LPYIGRIRNRPRTWFTLGYGGNGITFSMIAARLLVDALQDRPNPDAHLFSFDRAEDRHPSPPGDSAGRETYSTR